MGSRKLFVRSDSPGANNDCARPSLPSVQAWVLLASSRVADGGVGMPFLFFLEPFFPVSLRRGEKGPSQTMTKYGTTGASSPGYGRGEGSRARMRTL